MSDQMDKKIDMAKFLKNRARILSDRDEGIKARSMAELDSCDRDGIKVLLIIPKDDMWNITPSFFGGMFEKSIIKYREEFWKYYCFIYKDGSQINEELQEKMNYNYNYILERLE